jgi:hypothetical protein
MAKQVFETPDILRLIYSFGDPSHREFTRTLERHLECKAWDYADFITNLIYKSPCSIDCVLYETPTSELEGYLYNFKRCFCCARHANKKPIWSNKKILITGPCVFQNKYTECDCPCRSLSRDFIRHLKCRVKE